MSHYELYVLLLIIIQMWKSVFLNLKRQNCPQDTLDHQVETLLRVLLREYITEHLLDIEFGLKTQVINCNKRMLLN